MLTHNNTNQFYIYSVTSLAWSPKTPFKMLWWYSVYAICWLNYFNDYNSLIKLPHPSFLNVADGILGNNAAGKIIVGLRYSIVCIEPISEKHHPLSQFRMSSNFHRSLGSMLRDLSNSRWWEGSYFPCNAPGCNFLRGIDDHVLHRFPTDFGRISRHALRAMKYACVSSVAICSLGTEGSMRLAIWFKGVYSSSILILDGGMTMQKGIPLHILSGNADMVSFQQEIYIRHGFGGSPINALAPFGHFTTCCKDLCHLSMQIREWHQCASSKGWYRHQ